MGTTWLFPVQEGRLRFPYCLRYNIENLILIAGRQGGILLMRIKKKHIKFQTEGMFSVEDSYKRIYG